MPERPADLDLDAVFAHAAHLVEMEGEPAAIEYLQQWHAARRAALGLPPRAPGEAETGADGDEDVEDAGDE